MEYSIGVVNVCERWVRVIGVVLLGCEQVPHAYLACGVVFAGDCGPRVL